MTYGKKDTKEISEPHACFHQNLIEIKKWLNCIQFWDDDLIVSSDNFCKVTMRKKNCWEWEVLPSGQEMSVTFNLKKTLVNRKNKDGVLEERETKCASSFSLCLHQESDKFYGEVKKRFRQLFDHGYIWKDKKSPSAQSRDNETKAFQAFTPEEI